MIRSGDHVLWLAALARGRADADRPEILVSFRVFGAQFREACRAAERALEQFGRNYRAALPDADAVTRFGEALAGAATIRGTSSGATRSPADRAPREPRPVRGGIKLEKALDELAASQRLYPRSGRIDVSPRRTGGADPS